MKKQGWIPLVALCLLLLAGVAWASTTQTPAIDWQVLSGGGGHLEKGNVSLDNTLGQPVVGTYGGGNAELCVGFWCRSREEPGQAPAAGFRAAPRQGEVPLTATFTDTSSFTPTQWLWSFGDGDTAGVQNPTHTYTDAGMYTVSLTVSNTHGGDSLTRPNYITVTPPVCQPVFSATVSGPTTGLTDTVYSFVATVSPPTATTPITYTWTPEPDAGQGSEVVSYTWATTGTRSLSLTVSNCGGAGLASDAHQIEIIELPSDVTPVTGVSVQGPTAGTVNTSYTFSASLEPPTATTPITYTWTPEPDSDQGSDTVSYSWAISGAKTIAVTAQNEGGGATDEHQIEISLAADYHVYIPVVIRVNSP